MAREPRRGSDERKAADSPPPPETRPGVSEVVALRRPAADRTRRARRRDAAEG